LLVREGCGCEIAVRERFVALHAELFAHTRYVVFNRGYVVDLNHLEPVEQGDARRRAVGSDTTSRDVTSFLLQIRGGSPNGAT
jgi:hypothetical protein